MSPLLLYTIDKLLKRIYSQSFNFSFCADNHYRYLSSLAIFLIISATFPSVCQMCALGHSSINPNIFLNWVSPFPRNQFPVLTSPFPSLLLIYFRYWSLVIELIFFVPPLLFYEYMSCQSSLKNVSQIWLFYCYNTTHQVMDVLESCFSPGPSSLPMTLGH